MLRPSPVPRVQNNFKKVPEHCLKEFHRQHKVGQALVWPALLQRPPKPHHQRDAEAPPQPLPAGAQAPAASTGTGRHPPVRANPPREKRDLRKQRIQFIDFIRQQRREAALRRPRGSRRARGHAGICGPGSAAGSSWAGKRALPDAA